MPYLFEFAAIGLLGGVAWFWYESLARRETAVDAARRACIAENVQFLDDTVALARHRDEFRRSVDVARELDCDLVRVFTFSRGSTAANPAMLRRAAEHLAELRAIGEHTLIEPRTVGRGKLPSTVLGLLFHSAEHIQRHVGQLLVTIRVRE